MGLFLKVALPVHKVVSNDVRKLSFLSVTPTVGTKLAATTFVISDYQ